MIGMFLAMVFVVMFLWIHSNKSTKPERIVEKFVSDIYAVDAKAYDSAQIEKSEDGAEVLEWVHQQFDTYLTDYAFEEGIANRTLIQGLIQYQKNEYQPVKITDIKITKHDNDAYQYEVNFDTKSKEDGTASGTVYFNDSGKISNIRRNAF